MYSMEGVSGRRYASSSRRARYTEGPSVTLWIWLHRVSRLRAGPGQSVMTRGVAEFSEHRISDDWFVGDERENGAREDHIGEGVPSRGHPSRSQVIVRMGPKNLTG